MSLDDIDNNCNVTGMQSSPMPILPLPHHFYDVMWGLIGFYPMHGVFRPAYAWFLKIDCVQASMCVSVCVCVYPQGY